MENKHCDRYAFKIIDLLGIDLIITVSAQVTALLAKILYRKCYYIFVF